MTTTIRLIKKEDYQKLTILARNCFWNLYIPGCQEHLVVHNMMDHPDTIHRLCYVLELDDNIIGAIFYSKSSIVSKDKVHDTISFGPVMIDPKYHRLGYGRQLITYSIEQARTLGYRAILTLGYPYHYKPYGFLGGKAYHICMMDNQYYQGLLVLPLYKGALNDIQGYACFSDVFEITENEVELFDQEFEEKEKLTLPCQEEYAKACVMLDDCDYDI